MVRHGIDLHQERFREFCTRHDVQQIYVFGSILREDFGPDSDVDFLVRLREGVRASLRGLMAMEDELAQMVGRPVDVVLSSEIDAPDANPYRKQQILSTMEPVYAG